MIEVTRLPKNRGGFERFPNEAARNPDLSLAAIGLLARLLVDGNKFSSIAAVAEYYASGRRGGGRDAYLEAAKELAAAGHLVRAQARGAGGRMTTTIAVYAEPVNAKVAPGTVQPVPESPAETGVSARQTDNGSAVIGAGRQDTADAQVMPGTVQPSPVPSAEMAVPAGRTENGPAVPLPYTDSLQTYRPPPPDPGPAAAAPDDTAAAGDSYAQTKPNPDAEAVIDKLDLQREPGRSERALLLAPITAALTAGWTVPDLITTLDRDWTGAKDRVRTAVARAKDLGRPPRATASGTSKPPWCGQCEQSTRILEHPDSGLPLGRCPRCHPTAVGTQRPAAAGPYRNPTDHSVYFEPIQ